MDAEHRRPLAAFVVVTVASALLLGQSFRSQSPSEDSPAATQTSARSTSSASASASPANGQVVEGVTPVPTTTPIVKSIGRAPMLLARGDDGQGISVGAVKDPADKQTDPVRTRDDDTSPGPQGQPGPPEPKPSGGPPPGSGNDGSPGNSGGHAQGPRGNHGTGHDGVLPTPPSHGPR